MQKIKKYYSFFILGGVIIAILFCLLIFTNIGETFRSLYISLSEVASVPIFPFYVRLSVFLIALMLIFFLYRTSKNLKKEIQERQRAEQDALEKGKNLETSLALSKATLEATADGILVVDRNRRIVGYNKRLAEMWNVPAKILRPGNDEEAVGFVLRQLKDPAAFIKSLEDLYNAAPEKEHLDELEFKDGRIYERYTRPQMEGNDIIGRVFSFRDVTQRKKMEEQLLYQATHDSLTLLPNRIILIDRISQAIAHVKRTSELGAVLFFDLDLFKLVNDSLGHDIGDILLQAVAKRLQHCIRGNDTVARLGGDEFVMLLTSLGDPKNAIAIAAKSLKALEEPFVIDKHTLSITASVGISFLIKDGTTPIELLKNADSAMYYAKAGGRNNYRVYAKKMGAYTKKQLELTNELHDAVKNNDLTLCYQPLVDIKTSEIVGAEALLRWNHPKLGFISPQDFIPVAEDTGLILVIGEWALYTACLQNKIWQSEGLPHIKIAINLSGQQFKQRNIPDLIEKTLKKTRLEPKYLDVELTESVIMDNTQSYLKYMLDLKKMGVNLVIDDFGTGYSSLSYLKRFPVNTLKIDLSFIAGLPNNSDDVAIVRAILAMSKHLNMNVVAEGIETQEQLDFLRDNGCQMGQGFLFSKAVPAEELSELLKKNNFAQCLKDSKKSNVTPLRDDLIIS